jgi:hypothetical protein
LYSWCYFHSVARSKKPRPATSSAPHRRRRSRSDTPSGSEGAARALRRDHYLHDPDHPERFLVLSPRGSRDLHAAFLRIAFGIGQTPRKNQLWLYIPSVSADRIDSEWLRFRGVLKKNIADRLSLVALTSDRLVSHPLMPPAAAAAAGEYLLERGRSNQATPEDLAHSAPSMKFFDVWKVLVDAWFNKEGALPLHEIGRRAGGSSPTVALALERLRRRGELALSRNRPVGLQAFPRATLREIVAISDSLRKPLYYKNLSGRAPDAVELLRRIATTAPRGIAVGGVVAARVHDKRFDLNGIPRIDVIAERNLGLDWLRALDPALQPVPAVTPSPTLVLHPVTRVQVTNAKSVYHGVPIANQIETLLDLYELRLTEQAEDLIRRAEGSARE